MLDAYRCRHHGGYVGAALVLVGHAKNLLFQGHGGSRVGIISLFVGNDLRVPLSEHIGCGVLLYVNGAVICSLLFIDDV